MEDSDKTKLATKNLETQLSLLKDIIDIDNNIIYEVNENAVQLSKILRNKKFIENETLITLTKEEYNQLFDIAYNLERLERFEKLGILCKNNLPVRKIKLEVYQKLK